MPSLRAAARNIGDSGQPLPMPFSGLANLKFFLRRGQVTQVVAAPGVGKSVFAQAVAYRGKVPTLHLWPDGDELTNLTRLTAMAHSLPLDVAEAEVNASGELLKQVLDGLTWIRTDHPSGPDLLEVGHRVWAYGELVGMFPHLLVVDNLMDLTTETEGHAGEMDLIKGLSRLAKAAGCAVLVLLHATGKYEEDVTLPIPLGGSMGKVGKSADHVLSLYEAGPNHIWAAVTKNRWGPRDAAGVRVRAKLYVDYERMQMWSVEDLARSAA